MEGQPRFKSAATSSISSQLLMNAADTPLLTSWPLLALDAHAAEKFSTVDDVACRWFILIF